jgi:DNA-binding GntR family transcriptional regulator
MYQSSREARHSSDEHVQLVRALAAHDADGGARLMAEHLAHVEQDLTFERPVPSNDITLALS